MEINTTNYKHSDLVTVSGRIDGSTAPQLGSVLKKLLDEKKYKIVVDLSKVDFISSAGFRELISAQKESKRYNRGEVVLVGVSEKIYKTLDLAGFTKLFRISDNLVDAIGNL